MWLVFTTQNYYYILFITKTTNFLFAYYFYYLNQKAIQVYTVNTVGISFYLLITYWVQKMYLPIILFQPLTSTQ